MTESTAGGFSTMTPCTYTTASDTHSRRPPGLLSTGTEGHETGQTAPGTKEVYFNEDPQMF